MAECSSCGGSGKKEDGICTQCNGTGQVGGGTGGGDRGGDQEKR